MSGGPVHRSNIDSDVMVDEYLDGLLKPQEATSELLSPRSALWPEYGRAIRIRYRQLGSVGKKISIYNFQKSLIVFWLATS